MLLTVLFSAVVLFLVIAAAARTTKSAAQRIMAAYRVDNSAFRHYERELAGGRAAFFHENRVVLTDSWLCFPPHAMLFPLREITHARQRITSDGEGFYDYSVVFTFSNGMKFVGGLASQSDLYLFTAALEQRSQARVE